MSSHPIEVLSTAMGAGAGRATGGGGTAQARQPRPMIAALTAAGILGPVVFAVVAVAQGLRFPIFAETRQTL